MTQSPETPEQKLWKLEQKVDNMSALISNLVRLIEGTDARVGIKETLTDVQREIKRLTKVTEQLETLEDQAVRKEEFRLMEQRLQAVEKRETLNQGASLGRKGLWAIIVGALTFTGMLLAILLQVSSLSGGAA